MAEKGLGMGLGALFGDESFDIAPNDFEYLPVSKIEPRADQPRTVFDEQGIEELADSIKEHGIIQPLTVRAMGDGFYQIIAGERRWRAARLAGLDQVPARIIVADDAKAMELALVENLQRENLNPAEEARGYKTLVDEYGLTQEDVAKRVGKSRPVVANAMRLLNLAEHVLDMLERGEIAPGAARAVLSITDSQMQIQVAERIVEENLSVREAERLVKSLSQGSGRRAQAKKPAGKNIYVEEAQRTLSGKLSRKVKIAGMGDKGKIEIEYYDSDDFERLYSALIHLELLKGDK